MNFETILDAMEKVRVGSGWDMDRRIRQYNAFRARILQKYHALELLVQLQNEGLVQRKARIAELEQERDAYRAKAIEGAEWMTYALDADQRIAELEDALDWNINIVEQMTKKKEGNNEQD